ncbi:hypothetical protein O0L34_g10158 [Tuta absoluta]|nr:hypothetical protein O0L34_g10158 [Tuta absoluta]
MSIVDINIPKLIAGVKKRPALYDTSHLLYREKSKKKKLWQEVFTELCTPAGWNMMSKKDKIDYGYEVTKKWNSLRSCYRREIVYQHRASKGLITKRKRKYYYFDSLMFLLPFTDKVVDGDVANESTIMNRDDDDDSDENNEEEDNQSEENHYYSDTYDDTRPTEEIMVSVEPMKEELSCEPQATNANNDEEENYVSFKKYRSIRQAENEEGVYVKKYRSVREESKNTASITLSLEKEASDDAVNTIIGKEYQVKVETVNEEEADVSFLQSLLPAMRELSSDQKLLLRIEIMRTIYKFKQNLR